jgi:hypothetical protein
VRKIQAKDLALLPAERKQPQIDKQIKILHMLEKKARSDNERTLVSIYDKNSAAAKSKQASIAQSSKYRRERDTFRDFCSIFCPFLSFQGR